MIGSKAVRIVMALLLATWSPVWCQCVLLAATQGPLHAASIETTEAASVQAACHLDCCDDEMALTTLHAVPCCPIEGDSHSSDEPCPCCGKIVAAGMPQSPDVEQTVAKLPPIFDLSSLVQMATAPLKGAAGRWNTRSPHALPSTESLLAKRCLLLI